MTPPFKVCPACRHIWPTREKLLSDPAVALVGYQPHFEELVAGLMLFNHRACHTTLAIEVAGLRDLYVGEVARMLGGRDSTSVTLDHARELLESARE